MKQVITSSKDTILVHDVLKDIDNLSKIVGINKHTEQVYLIGFSNNIYKMIDNNGNTVAQRPSVTDLINDITDVRFYTDINTNK